MNEHGGVDARDVHDTGRGYFWNGGMWISIGGESLAFGAFWAGAFDDIGVTEVFVRMCRISGLRVSRGEHRRATQAKGKFMSSRGVMRTFHGVVRGGGVIVGRQWHHVGESDARSLRQDGDQNQC